MQKVNVKRRTSSQVRLGLCTLRVAFCLLAQVELSLNWL